MAHNRFFRLLLIQPPIQDFYQTEIRLQPIGLCYLKAVVEKHLPDFKVTVKDYHHGWGRRSISLPHDLNYLREYYPYPDKSPFSTFYHYYHFGASFETIAREVAKAEPSLVGISSLFSPYYREVIQTSRAIKKTCSVPIIAGGSHVSAIPELMLRQDELDFVIRGEGERPLVEFLKAWRDRIDYSVVPNLGFKRKGRLVFNPMEPNYPIGDLPIPDTSDLAVAKYQYEKKPLCFITTSRGCAHKCSFCSVHLTFGNRYRKRSAEQIFDEIVIRFKQGYRVFDFEDDDLTYNQMEMRHLCQLLISHFKLGDLQCLAMNGISYLSLSAELLKLMKQAGFTHLNLALVTTNDVVRKKTKRPHSIESYQNVVSIGFQLGFHIVSYQILGLPEEERDSMIETLVTNTRLPVLLGVSIFYLTPNAPISIEFDSMDETDIFRARLTAMAIETPFAKRKTLFTLLITARIINFLKGQRCPSDSSSLSNLISQENQSDLKNQWGFDLLHRLFTEKRLYTISGKQRYPVKMFDFDLFQSIWKRLEFIQTQGGKKISSLDYYG